MRSLAVLALAGCLVMSCAPDRAAPREGPLLDLLPGDEVGGWAKDGGPEEYEGEALYTYINGGAEIYHEYGFRRVILQDYKSGQGKPVSLEIFEMETPAAAYGMFTFKRSGKGETVPVGAGAELESYYLNFWKGRFLATLTGFDEEPATVEGLMALGKAVDARVRGTGDRPGLAGALPEQGLRPGSVKYVRGLLGLNSIYPFPSARGLLFDQGAAGVYGSGGATLLILDYGSVDKAEGSRAQLAEALSGSGGFTPVDAENAAVLCFRDAKARVVCLAGSGTRMLIAFGPEAFSGLELIGRVR
ncbi:MAG: DUF6599 family protein [Candidatus Aminicenantes bacterium]